MRNGRCRMHGGRSRSGAAHGRYRHRQWTREAIAARRQLAALVREVRQLLHEIRCADTHGVSGQDHRQDGQTGQG
jgi:hypothetical protein